MILRAVVIAILAATVAAASAQEPVTVGTQRALANGALFLAATHGEFKAEGLTIAMRAYPTATAAAEALARGDVDFAVSAFSARAFDLAGKGTIVIVAAQMREKRDYEGNELIASNAAYAKGLRTPKDLAGRRVAIDALGSPLHYQLGELARNARISFDDITLKTLQTPEAIAAALRKGTVDAALLPAQNARELLVASEAKLIGWCSQWGEPQLGAVFTTAKTIEARRATVAKFVQAYARGAAAYADALLRRDRYHKRISDAKAHAAAAAVARYVYPGNDGGGAVVEANATFIDPKARVDRDDIARQIAWYKAQELVGKDADAGLAVDLSFTAGQ